MEESRLTPRMAVYAAGLQSLGQLNRSLVPANLSAHVLSGYPEAQVHGGVNLKRDVEHRMDKDDFEDAMEGGYVNPKQTWWYRRLAHHLGFKNK